VKRELQRRAFAADIKIRKNPDGTIGVRGYAAVFGQVAYGETITKAAFNRSLAQRDDVRLLVNHDGVPLARTKSGTMTLGVDDHGEWFDVPSLDPANPKVQELVSAMDRGDIDQCSFAGYFLDVVTVDGVKEVREVQQCDVSIVTYPWYDETEAGLTGDRDVDRAVLCLRSLTPEQRAAVLAVGETPATDEREKALRALRAAPPGKQSYWDIAADLRDAIESQLSTMVGADVWIWIEDFGADWVVYATYGDGKCNYFQIAYSIAEDGAVSLGSAFPVELVAEYRPIAADPPGGERGEPLSLAEARALLGLDPAA